MSECGGSPSSAGGGGVIGEIMLFGVRVKVDPMRKSVSMNNLSEYEPINNNISQNEVPTAAADNGSVAGYVSADEAMPQRSNGNRERKRGVPWTEEEHKLFLIGLQKVGKGDWRGISRNYVKTRTPTQVASHAQKYFLRRSNLKRSRRRTSLFDITTDSVTVMPIEESEIHQESPPKQILPQSITSNVNGFPVQPFPMPGQSSTLTNNPSSMMDFNFKHQVPCEPLLLSLQLSLSSGQDQPSTRDSAFQMLPSLKSGDNIISVA